MPVLEQIEIVNREELKQQNHIHKDTECSEETTIYGHVNQHMEKNISNTLREIHDTLISYKESEHLPNDEAIKNLAERFQKLIEDAKKNKVMFSVPYHIDVFREGEKLSIIDYLIQILHHFMQKDDNVTRIGKDKLEPLWLEISDLVSKGNNVSEKASRTLQSDVLQNRESYLSTLKQIVSDSIKNGEKKDVTVERDNAFYRVKCPEESVVTPAKFMNSPEFKDLEYGELWFGEGDNIIRSHKGKYHDMQGKVKMTFKVSDDEKIEMILSSENASGFGKIMVHMDDRSCEIFSKYLEELEKEPRINKVVDAAKSFVQTKSSEVNPPLSVLQPENVSKLQDSQSPAN